MKKVNSNYFEELQQTFKNCSFQRIEATDGMYITNDINRSLENDSKIFKETQIKRILRSQYLSPFVASAIKSKLSYFYPEVDMNSGNIYKFDGIQELNAEAYAIQNIGHATQLIQLLGFNILTDPVFFSLNWLLYPEKTASHPTSEELPKIDFILISHNHRDHVDGYSLEKILDRHKENGWPQPQIFVPKGDKKLFEIFGFENVVEADWYTKISVNKDLNGVQRNIHFISIPADHRSGRDLIDHHKSLVTGWVINPEDESVIFKFSGDTRSLSSENQLAVDAVLWNEMKWKIKVNEDNTEIPDIICLEPSGPNYTRCYMDITHQSTSYSALLKFIEAENLSKLSGLSENMFLEKIKTYIMHHRKFELGPDRFNEGLFIFKKLLLYLDLNAEQLSNELIKQTNKIQQNLDKEELKIMLPITSRPMITILPKNSSILVHAKDFIIRDIMIMVSKSKSQVILKEYLLKNTIFAKIGERLNNNQIADFRIDITNIPKYNKNKLKCKI